MNDARPKYRPPIDHPWRQRAEAGSEDFFRKIRAHFALCGSSLTRWARETGKCPRVTHYAARGEHRSKLSLRIVRELRKEAGL